jgi:hypothetical protein
VTVQATVYATRGITANLVRSAARLARVQTGVGRALAVVELDEIRIGISELPQTEIAAHVGGVRRFIETRCELDDENLVGRLDNVEQVLALAIDPDFDTGGKVIGLVLALARYGHGVVFDGTRFRDAAGNVLARTREGFGGDSDFSDPGTGRYSEPPSPERVLARAWVLSAVALRGFLEDEPRELAVVQIHAIKQWLESVGVAGEIEADERAVLDAPAGTMDLEQRRGATWRGEGLAVLGWALGVIDVPDHGTQVDTGAVASAIGFLHAERLAAVKPPRLRSPAELDWMARRLLGLRWRLREQFVDPRIVDFRSFASNAWFGGFDLVGMPLVDDDLAVGGVGLSKAPRDMIRRCHSIAVERHTAIGWLRGLHRTYSKVDDEEHA